MKIIAKCSFSTTMIKFSFVHMHGSFKICTVTGKYDDIHNRQISINKI